MELPTINDLFIIKALDHQEGAVKALLQINKGSEILKGHFPGQPVVPGACMLQLIREVLETAMSRSLQLEKAVNLKFITIIEPNFIYEIELSLSYQPIKKGGIIVTAKLTAGEVIFFKFLGNFVERLGTF